MDDTKKALDLICTIIAEEMDVNVSDLTMDTTLEDLEMNKDNLRQVLAGCEVEFDVTYEPEDYDNIRTVGDILSSMNEWELE